MKCTQIVFSLLLFFTVAYPQVGKKTKEVSQAALERNEQQLHCYYGHWTFYLPYTVYLPVSIVRLCIVKLCTMTVRFPFNTTVPIHSFCFFWGKRELITNSRPTRILPTPSLQFISSKRAGIWFIFIILREENRAVPEHSTN